MSLAVMQLMRGEVGVNVPGFLSCFIRSRWRVNVTKRQTIQSTDLIHINQVALLFY